MAQVITARRIFKELSRCGCVSDRCAWTDPHPGRQPCRRRWNGRSVVLIAAQDRSGYRRTAASPGTRSCHHAGHMLVTQSAHGVVDARGLVGLWAGILEAAALADSRLSSSARFHLPTTNSSPILGGHVPGHQHGAEHHVGALDHALNSRRRVAGADATAELDVEGVSRLHLVESSGGGCRCAGKRPPVDRWVEPRHES